MALGISYNLHSVVGPQRLNMLGYFLLEWCDVNFLSELQNELKYEDLQGFVHAALEYNLIGNLRH
jgi:hypothetical protein